MKDLDGNLIREVILGNDLNIDKLKEFVSDFFVGKTQDELDLFQKRELDMMVFLKEILSKDSLTEIDRARLDKFFFGFPSLMKYHSREAFGIPINLLNLSSFRDYLMENIEFEDKDSFVSWIDFILRGECDWEDSSFENVEKDFRLEMGVANYYDGDFPEISIVFISTDKFEDIINESFKRVFK